MPAPQRTISAGDVRDFVGNHCFTPVLDGRVGVEVEWFPVPIDGRTTALAPDRLAAAHGHEPGAAGSRVTIEPGGQVELSSPPLQGIGPACAALAADAATLSTELAADGIGLVGLGFDPRPLPERCLQLPRYEAMESYFDAQGDAGRTMMRATAAVQVNVSLGADPAVADARWHRAHDVGPTLAAAFANSPLAASPFGGSGPSGWRSRRLATWSGIDRGRTAAADGGGDGRAAYAQYALDARVMLIRCDGDRYVPLVEPLTLAEWIADGHELGHPTHDDLEYHLTTLFPPVRPKGWLELRMIDSLPDPWWRAAMAVATTLVVDDESAAAVAPLLEPTRGLWVDAARHGLAHPGLAESARGCFEVALDALARLGSDATTIAAVAAFHERYSARGRCPADDRLSEWSDDGRLLPAPDRFMELSWV
jgi:glutamate--cysteine ligase